MDSSKWTSVLLLLCGLLFAVQTSYGCMCSRGHPQESLCSEGSYAALVKIRNIEYVYMVERPKQKVLNGNEIEVEEKKSTTIDFDIGGSDPQVPKQEMEQVEIVVKDMDQLPEEHFFSSYIRYRVKVYETYKGLKPEEVQGKKIYIYTATQESMCGVELKSKEMYLLIGYMYEDRLMIGLCNDHFMWNSLDMKQRRAVRRNMRSAQSTCESGCRIETCWSLSSCSNPDKDTCMWTSHMERVHNKLNIHPANFACGREVGKQDARCRWNDARSNVKRGLRRRRHYSSSKSGASVTEKSRFILLP